MDKKIIENKNNSRCKTVYRENVIDDEVATYLFTHLRDDVKWEDGIRSRNGFTRKAKPIGSGDELFFELLPYVDVAIEKLTLQKYTVLGLYLNYYETGDMYTPNHSHKGTHQLVISLGAPRILKVGNQNFNMQNGSAIIFGGSVHGVPKSDTTNSRISIATFMIPS